jgi:hypothetical protein
MSKSNGIVGPIETGVRFSFEKLGITEPTTALECLAIGLAEILDGTSATYKQDKAAYAALSRELRLTLDKVAEQPAPTTDAVEEMAGKY